MALLPTARQRVTTAAGTVVSGGKLRLYNAGTNTLTPIYTDAAMVTPAANPLVAASDGVLPQFFAPDGTLVDGDYLTPGNVVIAGQSFVSATFVGTNSGVLTRDFTNSRLRISGSAGIVSIEGGDPTGDDVGGKLRLGGYNGTQGDSISLDAAAITTTTDTFTINGKKLAGVVDQAGVVFSSVANVIIPLTNLPTGVRAWTLEVIDLVTASPSQLYGRLSYDSGATYKSGATDYNEVLFTAVNGSTTVSSSVAAAQMQFTNTGFSATNKPANISFDITTPNSGSDATVISSRFIGWNTTPGALMEFASNFGTGGYGRATHLKLYGSLSNISGVYRLVPKRGFGE